MAKKNNNMSAEMMMLIEELHALRAEVQELKGERKSAGRPAKAKGKAQTKSEEKVKFTKLNGEVIDVTPAQAEAYEKFRANRKSLDEVKAKFEHDRKAYKPTKAFEKVLKENPASITRKIAKEQYGFVGTKDDLKALKAKYHK